MECERNSTECENIEKTKKADKTCVFKVNNNKCSVLTKKACMRCNFFMTESERADKRKRVAKRLASLPSDVRAHIKVTYYQKNEVNRDGE